MIAPGESALFDGEGRGFCGFMLREVVDAVEVGEVLFVLLLLAENALAASQFG